MSIRVLHCSNNLDNFCLCLREKVAGFPKRGPRSGDLIYISVSVNRKSVCGARFNLDEETDYRPWREPERYLISFIIKNIEYSIPFDISKLSEVGGKYWGLKYLQGSKSIIDKPAIDLLDNLFQKNKTNAVFNICKL
jgi:hypothetical protein